MTTLIPKFQQPGTGAVNQPINLKLDKIPSITDFDTEANFNTYADTLSAQTNLAIKIPNTQTVRLLSKVLGDVISVKDFGALGDGTGDTPTDTGDDISNATWNTWDGTLFKTNLASSPYGTTGVFVPPTAKPFSNTDTWDYIGISLCLWRGGASYIPEGEYVINLSNSRGIYNGLLLMDGMEGFISGGGQYSTILKAKEDSGFFDSNNKLTLDYYKLITFYKTGGAPTTITNIGFIGCVGYPSDALNLTLIYAKNINGFTFNTLWLSSANNGVSYLDASNDSHFINITTEFLFGNSIYGDITGDFNLTFCNIWASAVNISRQNGVTSLNTCSITSSRFVNFYGTSIVATKGTISNNNFICATAIDTVMSISSGIVANNYFDGASANTFIAAVKDVSITGNYFKNSGEHSIISLGDGATATNIIITGNTFIKTNLTVAAFNQAIIAPITGISFTGAGTQSCIISTNTFQGPALTAGLGTATIKANSFDGVYTP